MLMSDRRKATQPHVALHRSATAARNWLWVVGAFFLAAHVPAGATRKVDLQVAKIQLGEPLKANFALPSQDRGECIQAEVSYGEEVLPMHLVRTSISGGLRKRFVRVESDAAINEPFVTVAIRTGCNAPRVRVFSLLPEPAGELALAPRESKRGTQRAVRAASRLKVEPWDEGTSPLLGGSAGVISPSSDPRVREAATGVHAAVFQSVEPSATAFSQVDRLEANLALLQDKERRRRDDIAELRSELNAVVSWPMSAWLAASVVVILGAASVAAALFAPLPQRPRRRYSGR
jgi:hypothetical protein